MNWKEHEVECQLFLNEKFITKNIKFILCGGSNSNESDIKITKNNISLAMIEVKMPNAQSGQFVVFSHNNKFSEGNNNDNENMYSSKIIDHMNQKYLKYKNPGTKGIEIDISSSVAVNWIVEHYKNKNAVYFITKYKSDFYIGKIKNLDKYFDIVTKYRVKKSGSRDLSKKLKSECICLLKDNGYTDIEFSNIGKKYYAISKKNIPNNYKLEGSKYTFYFKKDTIGIRVKILSNTKNENIIFELRLKNSIITDDSSQFLSFIQSL